MRPLVSPYHPGQRRDWIKVKNIRHAEVILGGWRPGQGRRTGTIGLLLLGVPDADRLRYAGHVGTGFTDLARRLHPLRRATRLFTTRTRPVRPQRAVGRAPAGRRGRLYRMTSEMLLRHPSWRGLRTDRHPDDLRRDS